MNHDSIMRSTQRDLRSSFAHRWIVPCAFASLVALVAVAAPACASKPTMTVKSAQVTGFGLMGVGVNVTTSIHNSNGFDIMVRRVNARVTIANRYTVGPVETTPNVWLGANQTTDVVTPAVIPWPLVLPLLAETVGTEQIPYRVQGTADVTATRLLGVRVNNEAVDESGVIPRQMVLSAARVNYPNVR